jgi:hypothetical protein
MQISEAVQKPDFPSSVSSRVCQTCVRAPAMKGRSSGCHGRALLGDTDEVRLALDCGSAIGI